MLRQFVTRHANHITRQMSAAAVEIESTDRRDRGKVPAEELTQHHVEMAGCAVNNVIALLDVLGVHETPHAQIGAQIGD